MSKVTITVEDESPKKVTIDEEEINERLARSIERDIDKLKTILERLESAPNVDFLELFRIQFLLGRINANLQIVDSDELLKPLSKRCADMKVGERIEAVLVKHHFDVARLHPYNAFIKKTLHFPKKKHKTEETSDTE